MEIQYPSHQRRAIIGDRHFILLDPNKPDLWALPGPVITTEDDNGLRNYGPPRTITTARLIDWARDQGLSVHINEKYPLLRRDQGEAPA